MFVRCLCLALVVVLQCGRFSVALGQPAGPEFQVNTYTTYIQGDPSVAADAAGNFVVVWESLGGDGSDTDIGSIQAQRYDDTGTPLGPQFQVNTYTSSDQRNPSVAAADAGNFVVVWDSVGSFGSDDYQNSIQGQRFDSAGVPQGTQFQVNSYTTSVQHFPAVAADSSGDFVVVWRSSGSAGTDTDSNSIQGQRFDSAGVMQGGEFQVNSYTTSFQGNPAVAVDDAGNFVAAWDSAGGFGSDNSLESIQAQRYDSSGIAVGGQFQVNTYTTSNQNAPSVDFDAAGNFVVVWTGYGASDPSSSVSGQRYDSAGSPLGTEFQVNTYTTNSQTSPSVAMDDAGNFVVVWFSTHPGDFPFSWSIVGQRYNGAGTAVGPEFQMNTYTTGDQKLPAVAADGAGKFVVAWESIGSAGTDTDSYSVQAQFVAASTTSTSIVTTSTNIGSTTSTTMPTLQPMPGRLTLVRFGNLAKFVAKPNPGDPTFFPPMNNPLFIAGSSLRIFDTAATAGDDTYALPMGKWKALGNPPGTKGFKYKGDGTLSDPCKVVLLKRTVVKAVCVGSGVTLQPPFDGEVGIDLRIGAGDHFCASFGGDEVQNDGSGLKRKSAPAPGACP
jgi:hypothetical protein